MSSMDTALDGEFTPLPSIPVSPSASTAEVRTEGTDMSVASWDTALAV